MAETTHTPMTPERLARLRHLAAYATYRVPGLSNNLRDPLIEADASDDMLELCVAVATRAELLDALKAFCGDYEATPTTDDTSLKAAYLHALEVIVRAEGR